MKINADTLPNYLRATIDNLNHHIEQPPRVMGMIKEMDRIFQEEIFAHDYETTAMSMLLAINSYMMLSNAVLQALSGHAVAVLPVARTALESACYAYLTSDDDEMCTIWFERGKSNTATDKCRKRFSIKATAAKLEHISPEMAEYIQLLYESTIEYGAHPNKKAIFHHLQDKGMIDDTFRAFSHIGVYGEDSHEVNSTLLLCIDVGQAIAFLLAASAKDHPFLRERVDVYQKWLDDKNSFTDEFNGIS